MNILFEKLNIFPNKLIKLKKLQASRGFTMIELLVTVSIFIIITTVVLANYPKFSSKIVLDNVAYQIALSVRQAQIYGLSVKEFGMGTGSTFPGYGIYFQSPGNDAKSFTIFADTNGDKKYNLSGCGVDNSECLKKFTIQSSEYIYSLCVDLKKDGISPFKTISDLDEVSNCGSINSLHISFTRPDPDATITAYTGGSTYETGYSDAEIVITSIKGDVKTVVIWTTGQISVE